MRYRLLSLGSPLHLQGRKQGNECAALWVRACTEELLWLRWWPVIQNHHEETGIGWTKPTKKSPLKKKSPIRLGFTKPCRFCIFMNLVDKPERDRFEFSLVLSFQSFMFVTSTLVILPSKQKSRSFCLFIKLHVILLMGPTLEIYLIPVCTYI